MWASLCLCVPGLPEGRSWARWREVGEGFLHFHSPSLGQEVYQLAFFAQVWTPSSSLTCLLMVAEPGLNLGPLSLIPWDRRDLWRVFCFSAP